MKKVKTITFALPVDMANDIEDIAQEEQITVSELIRESIRQYRSQRTFKSLAKKAKVAVKKKNLTRKDLGKPFEE